VYPLRRNLNIKWVSLYVKFVHHEGLAYEGPLTERRVYFLEAVAYVEKRMLGTLAARPSDGAGFGTSLFLRIPQEIRDKIYRLLLVDSGLIGVRGLRAWQGEPPKCK
jgi:hypothetical protein